MKGNFAQIVMLILDGFGLSRERKHNPVCDVGMKNLNALINGFPAMPLQASGLAVGLPAYERGNSEVGHLNLGAGRVVKQSLPRINEAIERGDFYKNPKFIDALNHARKNRSRLHLIGLVSAGGVHSHERHLHELLRLAASSRLRDVFIHFFTDGRDTPPTAALETLGRLRQKAEEYGIGKIASVMGRFYGMDRAGHWEVTEQTYRALTLGEGAKLTAAFTDPAFDKFSQKHLFLENVHYLTMTSYDETWNLPVAFPSEPIARGLSEILSEAGLRQTHLSESEKYGHVTYFFNGGREEPWPGERREIVSSPKKYQQRYEDVPEMSADHLGERIVEELWSGTNFVLANFANADMVGHTGNHGAAVAALAAVDRNVGIVSRAALGNGACLVISADHGNIEQSFDLERGEVAKYHTANPVPLVVAAEDFRRSAGFGGGYLGLADVEPRGVLANVAPTVLELFGVDKPSEMTSQSLLDILLGRS